MIVAPLYRKTKTEVDAIVRNLQESDINVDILLMIDYAFHNTDENYEEGLSFLDRLHKKLSKFYPIQWNIQNLKRMVRESNSPSDTFLDILNEILTTDMIFCYGL